MTEDHHKKEHKEGAVAFHFRGRFDYEKLPMHTWRKNPQKGGFFQEGIVAFCAYSAMVTFKKGNCVGINDKALYPEVGDRMKRGAPHGRATGR